MKRSAAAAAILIALGTTPALAENDSGLYLGAGVGRFNVEIDNPGDVTDTVGSFDADDTTFKAFAGWRFNPYIGVELDYIDLGNPEDTIDERRINADINGFAPYVVGTLPVGPVELFAKVGYLFYDVKVDVDDLDVVDDSNEDLVYGGGIGLTLFEQLHTRLEYEVIDIGEFDDANALWLSAAWRF
ncbi:MAG TPA: outer membrane beta-barrel protein [Steroidobacteraceae bacterium]|nr:outer membrane beta-barrel protein [Steroidobacteraceae bacterium]